MSWAILLCVIDSSIYEEQLLDDGEILLLLDGLDEVTQINSKRTEITRAFALFARRYDHSRIVATDFSFEQFAYVEMADFAPQQVQKFVQQWYGEDREKGQQMLSELRQPAHKRHSRIG